MKTLEYIAVAIGFVLVAIICIQMPIDRHYSYPCDLSEISPDMPQEAKDKCRALRGAKI